MSATESSLTKKRQWSPLHPHQSLRHHLIFVVIGGHHLLRPNRETLTSRLIGLLSLLTLLSLAAVAVFLSLGLQLYQRSHCHRTGAGCTVDTCGDCTTDESQLELWSHPSHSHKWLIRYNSIFGIVLGSLLLFHLVLNVLYYMELQSFARDEIKNWNMALPKNRSLVIDSWTRRWRNMRLLVSIPFWSWWWSWHAPWRHKPPKPKTWRERLTRAEYWAGSVWGIICIIIGCVVIFIMFIQLPILYRWGSCNPNFKHDSRCGPGYGYPKWGDIGGRTHDVRDQIMRMWYIGLSLLTVFLYRGSRVAEHIVNGDMSLSGSSWGFY